MQCARSSIIAPRYRRGGNYFFKSIWEEKLLIKWTVQSINSQHGSSTSIITVSTNAIMHDALDVRQAHLNEKKTS